jgi:hypothetical protein
MASTIKVTNINTPDGTGSITLDRPVITPAFTSTGIDDNATAEALQIEDAQVTCQTGDLVFATAGKGICLGVTSNTDANTLDDYEEGTWTPVIGGLSGESGQSYGTSPATYTKIGRLVVVNCNINLTAKGTISGLCLLKGLPFTVGSSSANRGTGSCGNWGNLASSLVYCSVYASEGTTYGYIRGATSGTATLNGLTTSDINDNTYMQFSMSYMT